MQQYYNIPLELRQLPQWVLWKLEDIGAKKPTKIPYTIYGELANVNDPSTWATFEQVIEALEASKQPGRVPYSGIGFVFTSNDPYTFIDLDDPTGDQATVERQIKVAHEFDSYSEISQSDKGLHIIVRGSIPQGRRRSNIEIYSSQRYAVMTGNVHNNKPICDYQDKLSMLYEQMGSGPANYVYNGNEQEKHEDKQIIDMAAKAVNGEKFKDLLIGNWQDRYQSQSEADLAFIDMLAFYTQNRAQITRIFRQSPLGARPKAKRNDYIDRMIGRSFDKMLPPIDIDGFKIAAEQFNRPVAQRLEPSAHNGLVVGSNPAGPTNQGISQEVKAPLFESGITGSSPVSPTNKDFTNRKFNIQNVPPGLMGEIAQFIYQAAPRPVPEIALAGSIALLSGICGRAYNISGTGLNQYVLAIAYTGVGKEAAASGIDRLMESIRLQVPTSINFIGPSEIASGQALVKYLNSNPCFVSILGEFGLRLQAMSNPNGNNSEVNLRRMLLDLFNKSGFGQVFRPSIYSDKEKNISATNAPAFTIFAESTPERFYGVLNEDMITEGLLPRFNLIEYTGPRPPRNKFHTQALPSMALIDRFSGLVAMCEQIMHAKRVINIDYSPDGLDLLDAFDLYCDGRINNAGPNEVVRHLWNRAHIKALKIAALIAVGVNMADPLITAEYANWAITFVVNDIQLLSSKFEQGQIGASTSELKQLEHARHIIREYIIADYDDKIKKYKTDQRLHSDKIVPMVYLSRRLAAQTSFRNDKMGSTVALKRVVQNLIDSDTIREIPTTQMVEKYGTRQKAYAVSNAKGLGE